MTELSFVNNIKAIKEYLVKELWPIQSDEYGYRRSYVILLFAINSVLAVIGDN